jgi:hypothetical protein
LDKAFIYKELRILGYDSAGRFGSNEEDTNVTIKNIFIEAAQSSIRSVAALSVAGAAMFIASCGGGGTANPSTAGSLAVLPSGGSIYALTPYTINIAGGRKPYRVVSNEQTLAALNFETNDNQFTLTANQPGVVDVGQDPNQVPSRRLNISVRDANGDTVVGAYDVLQNFLTGYSLRLSSITSCGATSTGTAGVEACAGADSLIELIPVTAGRRFERKQMRFTVIYGGFSFIQEGPPDGITGPTVTRTADDTGGVSARIRVLPNAPTQYAQFRLTDVATGNYFDYNFIITNANSLVAFGVLPAAISLTGANTAQCGFGAVNLLPVGGRPPYTAVSSTPGQVSVSPSSVGTNESFAVLVSNATPPTCISNASIIVTDGTGTTVQVPVTTAAGTTPPVLPLTVAPSTLCLTNAPSAGASGSILVSGGNNNKVVSFSNPTLVSATPANPTGTTTVLLTAQGTVVAPATPTVTVTISDGSTNASMTVTRVATTCP